MLAMRRVADSFWARAKLLNALRDYAAGVQAPRDFSSYSNSQVCLGSQHLQFFTTARISVAAPHGLFWKSGVPAIDLVRKFSASKLAEEDEGSDDWSSWEADDESYSRKEHPYFSDADLNAEVENEPRLYEVAMACDVNDLSAALDKWLLDGNHVLTRQEVVSSMRVLRSRTLYKRACQVSKWLKAKRTFEFDDAMHANHLDLLAKTVNIYKAEGYFNKIPAEAKGIKVYRSLLGRYAMKRHVPKAKKVFNKMKALGFNLTVFEYNHMLKAYLQFERGISELMTEMKDEGIIPNTETYRILIRSKGLTGDMKGITSICQEMRKTGIKPDVGTLGLAARLYIKNGKTIKAKRLLSLLEKNCTDDRRHAIRNLVWLNALLNNEREVERFWKAMMSLNDVYLKDYVAGILSWGKLGKIDVAEGVFESMLNSRQKVSATHLNALLKVYAEHKMLSKAEDLITRMVSKGIEINKQVLATCARIHVSLGDLKSAETLLFKDYDSKPLKPGYATLLLLLQSYSEGGDIENAERIFDMMGKHGFKRRKAAYEALIQAYIKGNKSASDFEDRMSADKFHPNEEVKDLLKQLKVIEQSSLSA